MSLPEQERPPFALRRKFILTPFEERFQGILQNAQRNRSWHIIAAVPGSGKSLGVHDFVKHSGAKKDADGKTVLPVLSIRAPQETSSEQALGQALSDAFGVVPNMPWYARIQKDALLKENANLRRTRDLLLSKLISGEIDISSWIESEEKEQELIHEMEPAKSIDVATMQQRLLWE